MDYTRRDVLKRNGELSKSYFISPLGMEPVINLKKKKKKKEERYNEKKNELNFEIYLNNLKDNVQRKTLDT